MVSPFEYWQSGGGLGSLSPAGESPEGPEFARAIQETLFGLDIVEFGCGNGRLAPFFSKRRYVGFDICPRAVEQAKVLHPGYDFWVCGGEKLINGGYALFAHTVMLHVPDELLVPTLQRFTQKLVVISEIVGRNWRRDGDPPVFNREIMEYDAAMREAGYTLKRVPFVPYSRYGGVDLAMMEFHRDH